MDITSLTFGTIQVQDDTIFTFTEGIPGLRNIHRYAIVKPEDAGPFNWLQACEEPFLTLMMLDPKLLQPDYSVRIQAQHQALLGPYQQEDLLVNVLVVVPQDPQQMTANLLAPIVFNQATRKAAQVVVDGSREMLRVKVFQG